MDDAPDTSRFGNDGDISPAVVETGFLLLNLVLLAKVSNPDYWRRIAFGWHNLSHEPFQRFYFGGVPATCDNSDSGSDRDQHMGDRIDVAVRRTKNTRNQQSHRSEPCHASSNDFCWHGV